LENSNSHCPARQWIASADDDGADLGRLPPVSSKRLPVRRQNTLPAVELEAAREAAETYAKGSRAASTWRGYESDWRMFGVWCRTVDRASLPAEPATEVMRGIRRAWKRPVARKAPAVDDEIKRMVDAVEPQTLKGLRDRALLLLGFAVCVSQICFR
jgi:integrase